MLKIFDRSTTNVLLFLFIFFLSIIRSEYLFAVIAILLAMIFLWIDLILADKSKVNIVPIEESAYEYD
jgi:hypothetical protein